MARVIVCNEEKIVPEVSVTVEMLNFTDKNGMSVM